MLQIENLLEVDSIKLLDNLKHSISPHTLSLKFQCLFNDKGISQFFSNLKTDLVTQQYVMQMAITHLENATPNFSQQSLIVQPGKKLNLKVTAEGNDDLENLVQSELQEKGIDIKSIRSDKRG